MMRRLLLATVALFPLMAHAELSPLLGTMNADNVTLYPGLQSYPSGPFHPMGALYTTSATAATAAGTAEQTLATYSLPANALDQAGRRLRIRAAYHLATNGNTKTMKVYFGSVALSSGALTASNKNGWLEMDVVKSGASTQIIWGTGQSDTTMLTPFINAAGAEADTAAIVIKFTGTDGTDSAADITLDDFAVEYMN